MTAPDFSASKGQVISASSLFSANDVDGDNLLYFFYDNSADAASGHFTVNGVVQAAGTTFAVSAAQLAQTTFTAGTASSDDLFVNVYDGSLFSGPKEFHVNVPANQAPTVTASDFSASKGQVVNASSLFSANDANGDTLLYFFYDNSAAPTSGHFTVNGVVQAAGTTFAVSAAQLAQTTFTAGTSGSDDLFVNVYDGSAFSGPKEFHVNVVNHAPTVTASNQTASSGQVLNASSLFSANDADGDSLLYFFYDNSAAPTSGHFDVNGVVQAAGTTFAVTQAQLAQTHFTAGTTGDDLFVNVWDQAVLQRTEGVPHRHRLKRIPKPPSRPLVRLRNSNTDLGVTRDRCRARKGTDRGTSRRLSRRGSGRENLAASRVTVRAGLSNISKVGVARQSELAALMTKLVPRQADGGGGCWTRTRRARNIVCHPPNGGIRPRYLPATSRNHGPLAG